MTTQMDASPMAVSGHGRKVCVTGAGGFVASWLVKLLLEKGYTVHGTVRNPDDSKNDHLRKLEGAKERLHLYKADLLDYTSLLTAVNDCEGVFHTASPVSEEHDKMTEAIQGTKNMMTAAAKSGVKRVVFTSSFGAVYMNSNKDSDQIVDESCWSDLDYCKNTKNWYCYGKTVAEQSAWELAEEKGIDLVVVNPVLVIGPLLQSTLNASTIHIMKYLTGAVKTYTNFVQGYVDVRDLAIAHLLVFESPTANGRYICAESMLHRGDVVQILKELFPAYPIPTRCKDEVNPRVKPYKLSNEKIRDLGLTFTSVKQSLFETVKCLQKMGHLPIVD